MYGLVPIVGIRVRTKQARKRERQRAVSAFKRSISHREASAHKFGDLAPPCFIANTIFFGRILFFEIASLRIRFDFAFDSMRDETAFAWRSRCARMNERGSGPAMPAPYSFCPRDHVSSAGPLNHPRISASSSTESFGRYRRRTGSRYPDGTWRC